MVTSQEQPPNNRKKLASWKLEHPKYIHLEVQPHVNLLSLIIYHLNTPSKIKKYFQCIDLVIFQIFCALYGLPIIIRTVFNKTNKITYSEYNCLLLSSYYATYFNKKKREN